MPFPRPHRIAITGGIAEGKSTVLRWLEEDGFVVASSDNAARLLFQDEEHNRRLAEIAGLSAPIAPPDLRAAILRDDNVRRAVNRYTHPRISALNAAAAADFYEVPLLIEACLQDRYDAVWVVTCGEAEQRRRLMERRHDGALVDRLLEVQLPTRIKCLFADFVLRTNRDFDTVRSSLREAVKYPGS